MTANMRPKIVIVVDSDIDVHDPVQVDLACAFRMQPARDMIERNDSDLWKRALYARSEQYSKAEGLVGRRIWQPI